MKYTQINIGGKEFFMADPVTWDQLARTITLEDPFMPYNPNVKEDNSEIINMFK